MKSSKHITIHNSFLIPQSKRLMNMSGINLPEHLVLTFISTEWKFWKIRIDSRM